MSSPVYIAGAERSGTSLLYAILASHPNIAMTRRTHLWRYFNGRFGDLGVDENLDACLQMMARYKRLVVLDPDWNRLRADFRDGEPSYGRLFDLLESQHAERKGKRRWGDKSLLTEFFAPDIFAAFPAARVIHMVRDPRDRYASMQKRWGRRRGGVGAGTAEWLQSIEAAEANLASFPDRYMTLRYEDLVSQPGLWTGIVCDFIDEPFTEEMLALRGAESFLEQGSNSSYGRREPGSISTDSIGRFVSVLSPNQIRFIEWLASDSMERLGYHVALPRGTARDRALFPLGVLPLELSRKLFWDGRARVQRRSGMRIPDYRLVEP